MTSHTEWAASVDTRRVREPWRADASAVAAESVVLPTPPLPVTRMTLTAALPPSRVVRIRRANGYWLHPTGRKHGCRLGMGQPPHGDPSRERRTLVVRPRPHGPALRRSRRRALGCGTCLTESTSSLHTGSWSRPATGSDTSW